MRRFFDRSLLVCLAAVFWGCSSPSQPLGQSARLEEVEGMVRVTRDGEWVEAEIDMEIVSGDEVATLEGGRAIISMMDDHIVTLSENSRFVLNEIRTGSISGALWVRMSLLAGEVVASLGKLAGEGADFTIATSTAVCAVKGTTFGVAVGEDATTVSVVEGEVDMAAVDEQGRAGGRIRLKSGHESTSRIRMRERLQARRMSRERRRIVEKRLGEVRTRARRFRKARRSGELYDIRRLRALARAGKLDEASGKLQKRLRRNPDLREKIIKHGENHRRLKQMQRQDRERRRIDRAPQGRRPAGQRVKRAAGAAEKARNARSGGRQAQRKEAVKPAGQQEPKVPQKKSPAPRRR